MKPRTREQLGASTGLVTVVLLGVAFIIGLGIHRPPDLNTGAGAISAYVVKHKDALQVEVLLNSLAMLFFLWFIGSVRASARGAEAGVGRVSALASGGALVGVGFVLLANVATAASTLHPGLTGGLEIHAFRDLSVLSLGVGAAAFAVFFIGVATVSLYSGGLPKLVGVLGLVAGVLAAAGLVTIFTDHGIFAADGAIGWWARYIAFAVWTLLASLALISNPPTRRR